MLKSIFVWRIGGKCVELYFDVSENSVIVELRGSMYGEDATDLREKLLDYLAKGYSRYLIRMHELEYIDSSGLGVLVAANKRALQAGGRVALCGMNGVVKELFELTRLNQVFEILN